MSDSKKYRTGFEMTFERPRTQKAAADDSTNVQPSTATFHIAVLGDFSGRDHHRRQEADTIGKRRLLTVDRDNLDAVLGRFDLNLSLPVEVNTDTRVAIPIRSLEDFHPDQLYHNVEVFAQLRDLRQRLQNKGSFADAARELQGWLPEKAPPPKPAPASGDLSTDNLLDMVVSSSQSHRADPGAAMVDRLIKQIVAPYVEPSADPRQDQMIAALDQAITAHMRFILHHPDFQALEAAWRALDFLVSRVSTDTNLQIQLLDVSKSELDADLSRDDLAQSGLYKLFCDPAPGALRFNILLGNFRFDARIEDVLLLLQLGEIATRAGAPFIAAAHEHWVGCESFATTPDLDDWRYARRDGVDKAWQLLRAEPAAEKLALIVPRVLLRAPYGRRSKPIETFAFEEMPARHCHQCYLWGNGAFVKVEQLARAFVDQRVITETTQLPIHYYDDEGEQVSKPCAEILLTEQGGRRLRQQGLLPLWSVKNTDAVRSSDFYSLAQSARPII